MEESVSVSVPEKVEPIPEEIVLPKLIQVAKRVYEENWVNIVSDIRCHIENIPLIDFFFFF